MRLLITAPPPVSGPTEDNRIKPDIIAAGGHKWVTSAKASEDCEVQTLGHVDSVTTLPSTAAVTGVAVLIRQYFTDGYYPSGVKNEAKGFEPMGALIKAVLVSGGERAANLFTSVVRRKNTIIVSEWWLIGWVVLGVRLSLL